MKQLIQEYLASPDGKEPAVAEKMRQHPDEAFDAIINFRGPYPENLDAIDVFPDYLAPLLNDLVRHFPRLLLDCDFKKLVPGQISSLLYAGIASEDPQLAPIILSGLKHRDEEVSCLVIEAIVRCPFLRLPEAEPQLRRLLTIDSLSFEREQIQRALDLLR